MLLRLFLIWTALGLKVLGCRKVVHRIGKVELLCYEIGPRDAPPWILLHGLGSTALTWFRAILALRKHCRLVVPELSAIGGTKAPGEGLDVAQSVIVMERLIETEFAGQPVTIAGISLGGWVATNLALERPELVSRLLLMDSAGWLDQDWDRIQELIDVRSIADVEELYDALFVKVPWTLRLSKKGFLRAYSSPAVRHVMESTRPEDAFEAHDLARLQMPVALIWGEHDGLFTLEVARAMRDSLQHGELYVLRGIGHAIHWEKPSAMVEAMLDFDRKTRAALETPAELDLVRDVGS